MVDYSVWDHIEVSDDEDETHPNIDTASLFRWRHQARVERMEQFQKEKEELDKGCRECKRKLAECQRKLKELELAEPGGGSGGVRGERERLQAEAQQLRHEEKSWESKLEELRKKEKNMPWNVDTLSKDGFSKSVFNVKAEEKEETEEQKEQKHKTFVERHEKQIKHFGPVSLSWRTSLFFLEDQSLFLGGPVSLPWRTSLSSLEDRSLFFEGLCLFWGELFSFEDGSLSGDLFFGGGDDLFFGGLIFLGGFPFLWRTFLEDWASVSWRTGPLFLGGLGLCFLEDWASVSWRSGPLFLGGLGLCFLEDWASLSWRTGSLFLGGLGLCFGWNRSLLGTDLFFGGDCALLGAVLFGPRCLILDPPPSPPPGMLRRWDDSQKYLSDNPHLVCEETANYLVIWCIDLEVEEKQALMEQVAHQTIVMQFILELAKSLKVDPRACFRQFFTKIKTADQQYMEGFNDELEAFKERVRGRAKARIERAVREYEEEERQKRLGPGGLDPVEVYESLPPELQKCFDAKDVQMLQDTISRMDPTEAKYHMQRCIDSGLWVPNAKAAAEGGGQGGGHGQATGGTPEALYEEIPKESGEEEEERGEGKA